MTRARARVLVVDDQKNMRQTTAHVLRQEGYLVEEADGGTEALERLLDAPYDVVITDLKMEPVDGLEVLRRALEVAPATQVVMMTAYGTVESAVSAMKLGAFDYLAKPFQSSELIVRVERALDRRALLAEVGLFADEFRERYRLEHIVGRSASMRDLLTRLVRIAPTEATVLITGESGTGKELLARAIHANSKRAGRAFVPVNCAAITETLLESELFGHAKGAFTGAVRARRGLLEEADGGTIFLDEIGETSPGVQAKLLRAIQEHEIRRVGESESVHVDCRFIAATNQDLRKAIAEKRFREDLFYRLAVVPLSAPPLRDRREDIPLLAAHFLERWCRREKARRTFTEGAVKKLALYDYPGNVRELQNIVEQAAALSRGEEIAGDDVQLSTGRAPRTAAASLDGAADETLAAAVDHAERAAIERTLQKFPGELDRVAVSLGVSATTLWRKMKRLGIG